jgi:PST family polysaccharide transporter
MIAKSKTKMFISTEIIFSITYVFLAYFLLNKNGIVGVTQAYMINYILYFIVIVTWSFKRILS